MIQNPNLADVRPGDEIDGFYLLSDATVRTSANGSRYLSATLSDRSGSLDLKMWDYSLAIGPENNGSAVRVRGQVLDYRGTKQLNVRQLRLAKEEDGVLAENLVPTAPIDQDEAMAYVEKLLSGLQDADYRKLAETLFQRRKEAFQTVPAAKSVHHGFRNGLLMHTANMLQTADFLADLYAEVINRDLLLAGTLLHDLAKTREFDFSPLGTVKDYSAEGRLLGHPVMGAQEVAAAAQELGVPQEKSVLLQHLLLSHHGEPEFGAAVLPMCAEAELLHLIDMIDSRMEIYAESLQDVPAGSFSEKIYALDKRIYKPRET
ncbi:MAG: HD domain-containing protein [Oscillospiraceae bacterium]|nr:HD domain-containing protein [Oscillospiraceae bacterium]